jgi:hypothetical protein
VKPTMFAFFAMFAVLASAVSAFGNDCIVNTYDNYVGSSCGIGDKTFLNFGYSTEGTNTMPSSSITANPINTPFNPGFLFNAPWAAQAGQTQGSLLSYTVQVNQGGNAISDLSLYMFGAATLGTGQVGVAETYCAGDTFADSCAHGTLGQLLTILNSNTSILHATATFNPVNIVDVAVDVEMLGGGDNSFAVLSGVQNQFSEVPEPGSILLMSTGALGLAGILRRKLML